MWIAVESGAGGSAITQHGALRRIFKVPTYRTIPTLRECLLVWQDGHYMELSRRGSDGSWSVIEARGRAAVVKLTSIGYMPRLEELYAAAIPAEE